MKRSLYTQPSLVTSLLGLLVTGSLLGLAYCALVFLGGQGSPQLPRERLLLYGGWFATGAVSAYSMLHGQRWGAYLLAAATLLVTVVEIAIGAITLGGASLGLLILGVVAAYLYTAAA